VAAGAQDARRPRLRDLQDSQMAQMIIGGERVGSADLEVTSPFDGSVVDTVPKATAKDVDRALTLAVKGAERMRKLTGYERYVFLNKAAQLLAQRVDEFGETITREEGKILAEARFEASRAVETFALSAEEAKRIAGQMIPLDGAPGVSNKLGFTLRVPCGVVVAITPFNFPLNLVAHKVGPALAAGNAVVIKPASDTPLTALKLTELLLEAGAPPDSVSCITGPGGELSQALCADRRVRKITFTGSYDVGAAICHTAGMKKVTMELGSNAPLIVMDDADLEKVAAATVATGYANAGQVCISAQRVLVDRKVYGDYLDCLKTKVSALTTGNPLKPETKMGPMIRTRDAERVHAWINEAVHQGARLVTGGGRQGAIVQPTIVADVQPDMKISRDELFGPAVGVAPFADIDEAIAKANDSRYGLSAAIFTENIGRAMKFIREVESGNLHVNWGTVWRADMMPYGGLKDSGMGKEGPVHAIREMTEEKLVVFHL
jgi:glyceraldehyde-3-phosphate dehydrogenase (NADP+)